MSAADADKRGTTARFQYSKPSSGIQSFATSVDTPENGFPFGRTPAYVTLPELTAEGCNSSVKPAAYTTVPELAAQGGLLISDNCVANTELTLSSRDVVTDSACVITVTRYYTVTDACGNDSTVSQTIKIHRSDDFTITDQVNLA